MTAQPSPRVIAEFNDYAGLLDGLRARAKEQKIALAGEANAVISGLPEGYLGKLIGVNPVKRIGMGSLGAILGLLAVKLIMVEDDVALKRLEMLSERYGKSVKTRNDNLVHTDAVHRTLTIRFLRKIAKKGGANSRKNLGKRERKQLARKAAMVRWGDVKEAVKS